MLFTDTFAAFLGILENEVTGQMRHAAKTVTDYSGEVYKKTVITKMN